MAKRILVVEDEEDILRLVTFRLRKLGYEILTATDGQKALALIREERPDLILLDLRLPIIDGYEICKRVKADEELKHIPVILLTAAAVMIDEKAKEAGADDYIIKPFDSQDLVRKMQKYTTQGSKNNE